MAQSAIAAQLYTLREFIKTPADIASTLKKVKQMGYDAVQLSALGPIDAKELAKLLKDEGLACAATHVSLEEMKTNPQKVIDDHRLWDCKYTAIGGHHSKTPSAKDWLDFIRGYNEVAKKFAGSGLAIGYHNHSHELIRFDGRTALDIMLEKADKSIWWEIDTYWITHGGGDPAAWIDRVSGRIPCVHFKDMQMTEARQQQMAEVGEGNLNWPHIIARCRAAGVKWYIVEQDVCQRDPFESLSISLKNLKAMGVD